MNKFSYGLSVGGRQAGVASRPIAVRLRPQMKLMLDPTEDFLMLFFSIPVLSKGFMACIAQQQIKNLQLLNLFLFTQIMLSESEYKSFQITDAVICEHEINSDSFSEEKSTDILRTIFFQ